MMQQKRIETACHSDGLWRKKRCKARFCEDIWDHLTQAVCRVPFPLPLALGQIKSSITDNLNIQTFNGLEILYRLQFKIPNNSGQIWLNFHVAFPVRFELNFCCSENTTRSSHFDLKRSSKLLFIISTFGYWGKTGSLAKTCCHYMWLMALSSQDKQVTKPRIS